MKQLKVARNILIGVGILTILINAAQFAIIDKMVEEGLNKQVAKLPPGFVVDPVKFAQVKQSAVKIARMILGGIVGVGVLYVVFGLIIYKYPVPVTITGLTIYVGLTVILAIYGDYTPVVLGIRIVVIVSLVKAVQAAIAYKRDLAFDG